MMWNCRCSKWPKGGTSWVLTLSFFGNSAFMGIYIISRPRCISLGPCNLWVMNMPSLKKWIPRRCLCFNMHTVYTVILVCLMLCTWAVSGSHKVNKVHTVCRIAVTLFFLHYFSAYKAENCTIVDYYTASSGSFFTYVSGQPFFPSAMLRWCSPVSC
jgi:hypothetical protein